MPVHGTPVTLAVSANPREDSNRWLSGKLQDYADQLGVKLKGEHTIVLCDAGAWDDPLQIRKRIACSCGWKKLITDHFWTLTAPATTWSVWIHDALKEHVLSFTDPMHYTYYPQGV